MRKLEHWFQESCHQCIKNHLFMKCSWL